MSPDLIFPHLEKLALLTGGSFLLLALILGVCAFIGRYVR